MEKLKSWKILPIIVWFVAKEREEKKLRIFFFSIAITRNFSVLGGYYVSPTLLIQAVNYILDDSDWNTLYSHSNNHFLNFIHPNPSRPKIQWRLGVPSGPIYTPGNERCLRNHSTSVPNQDFFFCNLTLAPKQVRGSPTSERTRVRTKIKKVSSEYNYISHNTRIKLKDGELFTSKYNFTLFFL